MGWARPAAAPAADARCSKAAVASREPGSASPLGLRGSPLDRLGNPGVARHSGRKRADNTAALTHQLPSRVHAPVGNEDLLPAASTRRIIGCDREYVA